MVARTLWERLVRVRIPALRNIKVLDSNGLVGNPTKGGGPTGPSQGPMQFHQKLTAGEADR